MNTYTYGGVCIQIQDRWWETVTASSDPCLSVFIHLCRPLPLTLGWPVTFTKAIECSRSDIVTVPSALGTSNSFCFCTLGKLSAIKTLTTLRPPLYKEAHASHLESVVDNRRTHSQFPAVCITLADTM